MLQVRPVRSGLRRHRWRRFVDASSSAPAAPHHRPPLGDHDPPVGPTREPPSTFVAQHVVPATQQHAVLEVGRPAVRPVHQVVHVAPPHGRIAAGEHAVPVAALERPPQRTATAAAAAARGRAPPTRPSSPPGTPPLSHSIRSATARPTGPMPSISQRAVGSNVGVTTEAFGVEHEVDVGHVMARVLPSRSRASEQICTSASARRCSSVRGGETPSTGSGRSYASNARVRRSRRPRRRATRAARRGLRRRRRERDPSVCRTCATRRCGSARRRRPSASASPRS